MAPSVAGYWSSMPKRSWRWKSIASGAPTCTAIPKGSARVCITAMVWGWQSCATKKPFFSPPLTRRHIIIASAAAVPSSSSDALASGRPVRSVTMVW